MAETPINILLVDDEIEFAETLALRLEQRGHRTTVAFDGLKALEAVRGELFDVVVLDLKMPGLNGIEVLKKIKADNPIVEVILLTAHGSVDAAVEGLKSGAFDFVQKPISVKELMIKLKHARQRKLEKEEKIRLVEARALTRRTGDI